jgi:hypothetical protein
VIITNITTGSRLNKAFGEGNSKALQMNLISFRIGSTGARGSVVVKALCYKPEGRGFDTRLGEFLNLPNLSGRTRPWGLLSL